MSIEGYIYKEGDDFYLGCKNTQKEKTGWGIMLYSYLDKDWFDKIKKKEDDGLSSLHKYTDTSKKNRNWRRK